MTGVFLDTSGLHATGRPGATHHERCSRSFLDLIRTRVPLFTSEIVLAELHALSVARAGPVRALAMLLRIVETPRIDVIPVDAVLRSEAITFLRSRPGRPYSLADAISFQVMRDRGITRAFTLDADFAAEGFEVVPDLG